MIKNSDMKAGRYQRWHEARKRIRWIWDRLEEGRTVYVTTATSSTAYRPKHKGLFVATKSGACVHNGKSLVCIDYCKITAH